MGACTVLGHGLESACIPGWHTAILLQLLPSGMPSCCLAGPPLEVSTLLQCV